MDYPRIFKSITKIGTMLLQHGAEIYRVEESVERLASAYGFLEVEVFAIPSFISISVVLPDKTTLTYTKRSHQNRIHMDNLCALNDMIRKVCNKPIEINELEAKLDEISNTPLNNHLIFLGYGLTALAFSVFFGGGVMEAIFGGIIGFVIYGVLYIMEKLEINSIVSTIIASMTLALCSTLLYKSGLISNLDAITIGSLMVLVPGVAITNSLRDLIGGEYISSLARMLEAVLIATSIAIGVGIITIIFGG